jgi:hypothetical protein
MMMTTTKDDPYKYTYTHTKEKCSYSAAHSGLEAFCGLYICCLSANLPTHHRKDEGQSHKVQHFGLWPHSSAKSTPSHWFRSAQPDSGVRRNTLDDNGNSEDCS